MKKIMDQIKKIRWPEKDKLVKTSVQTTLFIVMFAMCFLGFQFIISLMFKAVSA